MMKYPFVTVVVLGLVLLGMSGCRDEEDASADDVVSSIGAGSTAGNQFTTSLDRETETLIEVVIQEATAGIGEKTRCSKTSLASCAAELSWIFGEKAGLDKTALLAALVAGGQMRVALDAVKAMPVKKRNSAAEQIVLGLAHSGRWDGLDEAVELASSEDALRSLRIKALSLQVAQGDRAAARQNLTALERLPGKRDDIILGYAQIEEFSKASAFARNGTPAERISGLRLLAASMEAAGEWQKAKPLLEEADEIASSQGFGTRMLGGASSATRSVLSTSGDAISSSAEFVAGLGRGGWSLATSWISSDDPPPTIAELSLKDADDRLEGYERIVASTISSERSEAAAKAFEIARAMPDKDRDEALARVVPILARAEKPREALIAVYEIADAKLKATTAAQLTLDLTQRQNP